MSFYNENYNYPRNWNANGFGWVNPAALNQPSYPVQMPTPESSGYSSLNPSISGHSLSYGFAPGVVQPSSGGYAPAPAAPSLPYPTMGFASYGGSGMPMPTPDADYSSPQMPTIPLPMPGGAESSDDSATIKEFPFQAVSIPIIEGMFSSVSIAVVRKCIFAFALEMVLATCEGNEI